MNAQSFPASSTAWPGAVGSRLGGVSFVDGGVAISEGVLVGGGCRADLEDAWTGRDFLEWLLFPSANSQSAARYSGSGSSGTISCPDDVHDSSGRRIPKDRSSSSSLAFSTFCGEEDTPRNHGHHGKTQDCRIIHEVQYSISLNPPQATRILHIHTKGIVRERGETFGMTKDYLGSRDVSRIMPCCGMTVLTIFKQNGPLRCTHETCLHGYLVRIKRPKITDSIRRKHA